MMEERKNCTTLHTTSQDIARERQACRRGAWGRCFIRAEFERHYHLLAFRLLFFSSPLRIHIRLPSILAIRPPYQHQKLQINSEPALTSVSQTNTTSPTDSSKPPPLNIPPSRARRTLAARLAQRSQEQAVESGDPDAADATAVETASMMPEEGDGLVDLGQATDHEMSQASSGLQITGLRTVSGSGAAGRFSGLFSSSDSSEDEDDGSSESDEGDAGRDHTVGREEGDFEQAERRPKRRPSTTEAKERRAIDDFDDDDNDMGSGVFGMPMGNNTPGVGGMKEEDSGSGSSSDDEGMVEIRTRRSS